MPASQSQPSGRAQADALVRQFGKTLGVNDAHLDADDDRSFGECGFHYDPPTNQLVARLYIAKAYLKTGATQQDRDDYRKVAAALNNPKIGGMFENGGGRFVLDESKEMYFLLKAFPVATTTEADLNKAMETLRDIAARWRLEWFGRVADIAFGRKQPPSKPVKLSDPRQ